MVRNKIRKFIKKTFIEHSREQARAPRDVVVESVKSVFTCILSLFIGLEPFVY